MSQSQEDKIRTLKRNHQQLYRKWKQSGGPCIICGQGRENQKDHLPPKVLFPESLRTSQSHFFTFPVCSQCNQGSSDDDFLFSVLLSFSLNQESILKDQAPTDPDLLALYNQADSHLGDHKEAEHRKRLLNDLIVKDPCSGKAAINIDKFPVNRTITKIVKSIYWLHTGGDILQRHNPGWWILPSIDTSKTQFIEKHLRITQAEIQWEDKFIYHYTVGHPGNGAGGFISCSLHFYTNKSAGQGMNYYLIASPAETVINGISLYEMSTEILGAATIPPE